MCLPVLRPRAIPDRSMRGFSLVEIMVGLVIGLIAMLVLVQMLSTSEGQKRATLGADDAQNNGVIALDVLQREIRQSGFGISQVQIMGCPLQLPTGTAPALAAVTINPAAAILPAGDANNDTLLVIYGNSAGATQGQELYNPADLAGVTQNLSMIQTAVVDEKYYLWGDPSLNANDWVIPDARTAPVATAACATVLQLRRVLNKASFPQAAAPAPTATAGFVYNLGPGTAAAPSMQVLGYAVRNGTLTVCDYLSSNCGAACVLADGTCSVDWRPVASNIVSLRAQYGRDASTGGGDLDGVVDTYDQTTPATGCGWAKVGAIRLALVAQSAQGGSGVVTANAPTWAGSGTLPIDLSAVPTAGGFTWQNYRYKVFETVVSLRNNPAWMMVKLRDHSIPDFREATGCRP